MEEIYPGASIEEILKNAKRFGWGWWMKQYKHEDFVYNVDKKPFGKRTIACVHVPTEKVFGYMEMIGKWELLGDWNDFNKEVKK